LNGEVYSRKHGAYKDPKTNNIYRVVRNALVAKNGEIYTKAKQHSYVKLGGKFKKVYAYVRDEAAFKHTNGNIYKLAKKALVTKNGEIFTPNDRAFVGFGKRVYTEDRKAHIEGGIVYVKKTPLHMQNLKNKIVEAK